ncbi:MAG: hypothetical protein ACRC1W_05780 [Shewanella sp.]
MGFTRLKDYQTEVVEGGQAHSSVFRKTTTAITPAGLWFDGSTMSGHPVTNFYASTPLKAEYLLAREGIQHGANVSTDTKYLKRVTAMCSVAPLNLLLTDTLLYYPFIDGDSTDEQVFDNTNAITRELSGQGVMAFVVAQGAYTGGAEFFISYTNQNGVAGRISKTCRSNVAAIAGSVITSGPSAGALSSAWFIPLAQGDTGIRSVQSFTFLNANGGIFALVLCKDLGVLSIKEANVPAEKDFLIDTGFNMPVIPDGAYLSFLVLPNSSIASAPIYGGIQTVWG